MNSVIGTIIICSSLTISAIALAYAYIVAEIRQNNELAITRHLLLEDWLFQSLYSLNNKVLLPIEAEKPLSRKPAEVYIPKRDEMQDYLKGISEDE